MFMDQEHKDVQKVIVFHLANEEYAIPVEQVSSIERVISITRIPQTTSFIKGVINLRGVITPVLDLRVRFNMEAKEFTDSTRIIIVNIDEHEVGLIVDEANDVIDLPKSKIEPPPEVIGTVDADYIHGVARVTDRLLILLNLKQVLLNEEIEYVGRTEG